MGKIDPTYEKKLLKQVAEGNEKSFSVIFYAYHQRLGAYVYRITGSKTMAEEVVQDVFLKIWKKREKLLEVKKFDSYLFVMSKNHAFNCLRKVATTKKKEAEFKKTLSLQNNRETKDSLKQNCYSILDQAVEQLPPQQRKVYILSRRQRLKYKEIAQKMNISHETVKKYLQHATRAITSYAKSHKDLLLIFFILSYFLRKMI